MSGKGTSDQRKAILAGMQEDARGLAGCCGISEQAAVRFQLQLQNFDTVQTVSAVRSADKSDKKAAATPQQLFLHCDINTVKRLGVQASELTSSETDAEMLNIRTMAPKNPRM